MQWIKRALRETESCEKNGHGNDKWKSKLLISLYHIVFSFLKDGSRCLKKDRISKCQQQLYCYHCYNNYITITPEWEIAGDFYLPLGVFLKFPEFLQ